MRILFLAPYVPSRIRVRPFHLIKELSKRHQVSVIALGEVSGMKTECAEELLDYVEDLKVIPHSKLRAVFQSLVALPTKIPMCAAFCWSSAMRKAVSEAIADKHYDVMHIEHLRAAHFGFGLDIPIAFDSVDCLTGLFRQMYSAKRNPIAKLVMLEESLKLAHYEPKALARFGKIVATSDSESSELCALNPELQVAVIPNGVDTDYFSPQGAVRNGNRIVFSGKMSYSPNAQAAKWFAENVFPAVKRVYPDAEFVIVGSGPPPSVRALSSVPGVTVTGYVDDIRPHLDSAIVSVVPMQVAVGIQNKILESMAMGLPVVATPIAVRAFSEDFPGLISAASPKTTAEEIIRLLDNKEQAQAVGQMGRQQVINEFSWESSAQRLEQVYEQIFRLKTTN